MSALTTTFIPAPSCTTDIYTNTASNFYYLGDSPSACFPTGWASTSQFFSPGVCPQGYTQACSSTQLVSGGRAVETQATCCPTYVSFPDVSCPSSANINQKLYLLHKHRLQFCRPVLRFPDRSSIDRRCACASSSHRDADVSNFPSFYRGREWLWRLHSVSGCRFSTFCYFYVFHGYCFLDILIKFLEYDWDLTDKHFYSRDEKLQYRIFAI